MAIRTFPGSKGPDKPTKFAVPAQLLVAAAAATATVVMREPLVHTLPQQPPPFEYRVPNLLTSTLGPAAPSAQMPSTPLDLDTIPANTWRSVEPQLNLLANTLKPGVVVQPFSAVDLGRLFPAQAAPSWQPQHNLLLGTVPFRPVDQPLLQGVKGLFSFEQQNLLTSTLTPATAASPFRPIDFGPPQVTVRLGEFTTPNLLTSTLAPQQATPFTPADFSALSKVTGPQEYKPADLLTGVLLGQIQPFNQLAWPALTPTSQQPQVPAGANLALLTTPAPKPFFQVDWPALPIPLKLEPFLIPNTTINQVAPVAPPNLHKLYYDVSSGRLFWRVSETANPIEIVPL